MRAYIDSSALLKRVFREPHSASLSAALAKYVSAESALVTSSLAWIEVSRAVRAYSMNHTEVTADDVVDAAMSGVLEHPMNREVVALARRLNPLVLRSLDAIHLASALLLDVAVIVTYDRRLAEAAAVNGLRSASPTD